MGLTIVGPDYVEFENIFRIPLGNPYFNKTATSTILSGHIVFKVITTGVLGEFCQVLSAFGMDVANE